MATRTTRTTTAALYDEDFYLWAQRQADLLRRRRFSALDLDHLVEEVEDLARREWKAVRSHARRIIEHLLKLQFSPAAWPRGGSLSTVITQRAELEDSLTPSLRQDLAAALGNLYQRARDAAAADMRQDRVTVDQLPEACPYTLDQIPEACPYTLDQIVGPDWFPANVHGLADD